MKRKILIGSLSLLSVCAFHAQAQDKDFEATLLPKPHIFTPQDSDVKATILLISDAKGWGVGEEKAAQSFLEQGSIVIGIDFPDYVKKLRAYDASANDGCIYLVSDIETLSQQVQRKAGNSNYHLPIVAGIGEGGALALAIAAQTPDATIGETLAIDPVAGIPLQTQLCTPATKVKSGERMIYGLSSGSLPNPVVVITTPDAPQDGLDHIKALQKEHPDLELRTSEEKADVAFVSAMQDMIDASGQEDNPLNLPLALFETPPAFDTMAIVYSGDGGWRDIDKQVGMALQKQGIPVVGVDSLHYFWSKRTPEETTTDLGRIIEFYRKQWGVKHVLLAGYSFGADVLPAAFNRLNPTAKSTIIQMSLMSLSHQVDYEISVMGWLGASGDGEGGNPVKDLASVDPKIVQCLYGLEDEDDACHDLANTGIEVIALEGGHHFDENYGLLTDHIVSGLKRRLKP